MNWKCSTCGEKLANQPLCFGSEAPWRTLVPESEFSLRVDLTRDQCVVDEKAFFIRGHIEIPIHDQPGSLSFSVWSSLSEKSFLHLSDRWMDQSRAGDPPYFGWLSSSIPTYPDTINLKLSVQSRALGLVPLFTVEPSDHPLSLDQQHGISVQRWHELVHGLQHDG
ncbi:DUF2199 domain-containing protein [Luteimonas saliphila]|uniref:DUF2199 domain-containing protein n=1 Tax=Luteimonas saliphila TaxID=2804919 RepID=UPI00192D8210